MEIYDPPTRTRTADLLITNQLFCFFIINLNGLFQTMPVDIEFHDQIKRTSLTKSRVITRQNPM